MNKIILLIFQDSINFHQQFSLLFHSTSLKLFRFSINHIEHFYKEQFLLLSHLIFLPTPILVSFVDRLYFNSDLKWNYEKYPNSIWKIKMFITNFYFILIPIHIMVIQIIPLDRILILDPIYRKKYYQPLCTYFYFNNKN
jgi:hypothetical protein